MRAELAGRGAGEVGHQRGGGVRGQQHVSRPAAQCEEQSDIGHPLRICGVSGTGLNTEPPAVESANIRMPKHHPGAEVRARLAAVGGCEDELHGAKEVHVPCTVEGDAA